MIKREFAFEYVPSCSLLYNQQHVNRLPGGLSLAQYAAILLGPCLKYPSLAERRSTQLLGVHKPCSRLPLPRLTLPHNYCQIFGDTPEQTFFMCPTLARPVCSFLCASHFRYANHTCATQHPSSPTGALIRRCWCSCLLFF